MAAARVARVGESDIRQVVASGLVAIGVLCAFLAGVFRYVDQHFHDPEQFVEDVAPLADDAEVRERLFEGFRSEIITIANGGPDLQAAQDDASDQTDGASDLTTDVDATTPAPVTDAAIERDQAIEAILLDTFDSDLYRQVFTDSVRSVQAQVVRSAALADAELLRDPGTVTFDMRRLYERIYPALAADTRTAEITQNPVPPEFGVYPLADRETAVDQVWWVIDNGPSWRGLTTFLAIACLIGAVVIAERRPSRIIQYGGGMAGLAIVAIVVIYLIRAIVPVLASGAGSSGSVAAVYAANVNPLASTMLWSLLLWGVLFAALGGVAKLIWPDDWVYGQVDDGSTIRSIRRRFGSVEPEPEPQAAPAPGMYPPYGQPPYGGYPPPGWGQPWPPGQPYAPNPWMQYPVGPYAQPGPMPVLNNTNPAMQAPLDATARTGESPALPPVESPSVEVPINPAQVVPRVVAEPAAGEPPQAGASPTPPTPLPDPTPAPADPTPPIDVGPPTEPVEPARLPAEDPDDPPGHPVA